LSDAFFLEEGNNTLDYGTGILHGVEVENENGVVTENNEEVIFFYHQLDPCNRMETF
jgi:hypothetical protein